MATSPNGADPQALWHVQAEARSFAARREAVYPGRLLVLRGGSFASHPVDDGDFNPAVERIMGIAVWGACAEWKLGMVRVEEGPDGRSAPLIAGEANRPSTGVGRVDAWIARADALRKVRCGTAVAYGAIPLTQNQLIAAVGEIEKHVREAAIALLQNAPSDQRPALLALARVADAQHPLNDELTTAILELTASAPSWKNAASSADLNGSPRKQKAGKGTATTLPKTRRGFQHLAETTTKDLPIIAAIKEGKSYRQVAKECKVGKTTVERVAKAFGLTGHSPASVPLDGTLQENLSIRGKSRKRGS
jgi:hypothetical protein